MPYDVKNNRIFTTNLYRNLKSIEYIVIRSLSQQTVPGLYIKIVICLDYPPLSVWKIAMS